MFFLKNLFTDEGQFHASCLFCIPAIYPKCLLFQLFSGGRCMYIPILAGVQNGLVSRLKDSVFWLKNVLFEASFQWWQSLLYQLLFFSAAIDPKCLLFKFFRRGIRTHIPIETGVQNGHRSRLKDSASLLKNVFFEESFHWRRSLSCKLLVLYSGYLS